MIAAIDCGTNTIKLLVGDLPDVAVRESRIVRLGQGVDRTGRLADEALERTFAAIDEYAALIAEHDVSRIRFCATSATRDSSNGEVFADGVEARLGVRPDVLTGDEEAALAYAGAIRHLRTTPVEPVLVIDIGGGSTELILGRSAPDAAYSMDIGSVRMHERHLHSDPPTAAEIAACVADIEAALDGCPVDPAGAATVVGVAGTTLSVVAGTLDLPAYDRDLIDQSSRTRRRHPRLHRPPGRDARRRAARSPVDASRPRGRDRRRRTRARADPAPNPSRDLRRLRGRHPRRDRLVDGRVTAHPLGAFDVGRSGHGPCMSDPTTRTTDEPLGALVHRLSEQIPELVRSEMRLAQAELAQKGKRAGLGIGMFSAAGLLALFGLATLIATAVIALSLVVPAWAAGLIVAAVLLVAAAGVGLAGKKEVEAATPPAPEKTIASVREDVAAVKGGHA